MFKGKKLGIKDYKGVEISEGDVMKWPDEDELGVVRFEKPSCQFRVQFEPKLEIPSCNIGNNVGKKGRAFVVGSVYDKTPVAGVEWAVDSLSINDLVEKYEPLIIQLHEKNINLIYGVGNYPVAVYGNRPFDLDLIEKTRDVPREVYFRVVEFLPRK
jgi:hypothetical protein